MIDNIYHPRYLAQRDDWALYGLAYEGTRELVNQYLRKFSKRESDSAFNARKKSAYIPRYAAAAVDEIKDAILQRLTDIKREGGSATYQQCVKGLDKGVDYQHTDMTTFMGDSVLSDLLVYGKCGVLVDNYADVGETQFDQTKHPYVSLYRATDIQSWTIKDVDIGFQTLKLSEREEQYELGLVTGYAEQYRVYERKDGVVLVTLYKQNPEYNGKSEPKFVPNEPIQLDVDRIPFTVLELPRSLMTDIARIQVELMNIESSDIAYILHSNFPFLAKTYDDETNPYAKENTPSVTAKGDIVSGPQEQKTGSTNGVLIHKDEPYPKYISPPTENIDASMKKGNQLKEMIRSLARLSLQAIHVQRESKESKQQDASSMEAGLSVIAKKLERAEMEIAAHWRLFDPTGEAAVITYPKKFSLLSNKERIEEANEALDLAAKIPSVDFKRTSYKRVVTILYGAELQSDELAKIHSQLDKAVTITQLKDQMLAIENCVMDPATVAAMNGLPEDEPERAREAKLEFVEATIKAQGGEVSGARGVNEVDDDTGSAEKENKEKRGEAK